MITSKDINETSRLRYLTCLLSSQPAPTAPLELSNDCHSILLCSCYVSPFAFHIICYTIFVAASGGVRGPRLRACRFRNHHLGTHIERAGAACRCQPCTGNKLASWFVLGSCGARCRCRRQDKAETNVGQGRDPSTRQYFHLFVFNEPDHRLHSFRMVTLRLPDSLIEQSPLSQRTLCYR